VRQGESLPDRVGAENGAGACEVPRRRGVYVDAAIWEWQGLKWSHLLADDIDDLHRFAAQLGIHRASYQGPPRTSVPHYDLTSYERQRAIASAPSPVAAKRSLLLRVARAARCHGGRKNALTHPGAWNDGAEKTSWNQASPIGEGCSACVRPRVVFLVGDAVESGLVRLLRLCSLFLLLRALLLLRRGLLFPLSTTTSSSHLRVSRRDQHGGGCQSNDDDSHSLPPGTVALSGRLAAVCGGKCAAARTGPAALAQG